MPQELLAWLHQQKSFGEKATVAVDDLIPLFAAHCASNVLFGLMMAVFQRGSGGQQADEG